MRKQLFWIVLALSVITTSCRNVFGKRIRGDGNIRTEERSVNNFKNVTVSGAAKVMVSQGDKPAVKIEGDANLLQYIDVVQEGDRIRIKERSGFHLDPTSDLRIYVTAPIYNHIDVAGACDIIGQTKITQTEDLSMDVSGAGDIKMELDAPRLRAEVSGGGSINLKGQAKDVDLQLTGAGDAHCYDLLSENTKVDITGAGSAQVYASVKLDATVSGAGDVSYKGNAPTVNQHVSGAGSVKKAE